MQYLGAGLSMVNEIINPKDELTMFQQVCGGENICVYKGYLTPGENFEFISRRHYGFPFSASLYINGLIATRISSCCEYRYHVGFRQGQRGCFQVTQISGEKPCYRCVESHNLKALHPKEVKDNSTGGSCKDSGNTEDNVYSESASNVEETLEGHQQLKVCKMNRMNGKYCPVAPSSRPSNVEDSKVPAPNQRRRLKKKRPPKQESDSEQENVLQERNQESRKVKSLRAQRKEHRKSIKTTPLQCQLVENSKDKGDNGVTVPRVPKQKAVHEPTASGTTLCDVLKPLSNEPHVPPKLHEERMEAKTVACGELIMQQTYCGHIRSTVVRSPKADNIPLSTEDRQVLEVILEQDIHGKLAAAFAEEEGICSEVELSDSSDSSESRSLAELKAEGTCESQEVTKSLPEAAHSDAPRESQEGERLFELPATDTASQISEAPEDEDRNALVNQITDLIAVLEHCDEVEQLVLRNTGMTDHLLQSLAGALIKSESDVQTINLNLNDLGPRGAEDIVHVLKAKPTVKSLLLYGNHLGDEGIRTLMEGLSALYGPYCGLQGETAELFPAEYNNLTELDIGGNHITADGLGTVAAFLRLDPPLKSLGLAHCATDGWKDWEEVCDALRTNTNINNILLDENDLGDKGAQLLAEAIRVNTSLITIDLDGNGIGDKGGEALALSINWSRACALQNISLDENPIGEEALDRIRKAIIERQNVDA
ncbi:glutamate-rich protein 3 [Xenopus laevis]|nr:glutamate-rich protein 3 [Xenopus laevis]XP_041430888.1 glutamate-rich protein 3 [Xenopus laevis]